MALLVFPFGFPWDSHGLFTSFNFFISSFISSYSFSTLFIETNTSLLIFESNRDLQINTSILFNLDYAKDTILSRFFSFLLIIDLYILITTVIAQMFSPIAELIIPIGYFYRNYEFCTWTKNLCNNYCN